MSKLGERKQLCQKNGRYFVDGGIDITVDEWKAMLLDKNIFYPQAKDMIVAWYCEEDHMATSKTIMNKCCPDLKGTPYNGIVKGLANKILKHLNNRFWVEDPRNEGKECFWCIPFEGWHVDYDISKHFVWRLRDELVQAIDDTPDFVNCTHGEQADMSDELESCVKTKDGKKIAYYITKYERKRENRDKAIEISKKKNNGYLCCEACGFNFEEMYGERGRSFIEVHHNKPLYQLEKEIAIDPEKDLNCVCSNCHRMIHRNKSEILTVMQLKALIESNKSKNK